MFYNEEGYFIMRFHSFQDKDVVLMKRNRKVHAVEGTPEKLLGDNAFKALRLLSKSLLIQDNT